MNINERLRQYPWIGIALTGVVLAILLPFHDTVNLSLSTTFIFVVLSVYIGGLFWGLGSAGLVIIVEAFLLFPEMQYGRFVSVMITLLFTVWLVAMLQQKAVALDTVNGNIAALLRIMADLQDTLEDWDRYSRAEIKERVKRATDGVVNLTTKVKGWHDIRREMEDTKRLIRDE